MVCFGVFKKKLQFFLGREKADYRDLWNMHGYVIHGYMDMKRIHGYMDTIDEIHTQNKPQKAQKVRWFKSTVSSSCPVTSPSAHPHLNLCIFILFSLHPVLPAFDGSHSQSQNQLICFPPCHVTGLPLNVEQNSVIIRKCILDTSMSFSAKTDISIFPLLQKISILPSKARNFSLF